MCIRKWASLHVYLQNDLITVFPLIKAWPSIS
uniref:Uncharacterized protein n=1 Tax=Amphimedon queenslandica TaxID=400682 RepID=A0A1X7VCR7_AMPQE